MKIYLFKCDKCGEVSVCKADHIRKHKCPACNRHSLPCGEYNIIEEKSIEDILSITFEDYTKMTQGTGGKKK